jgi:hypothetical protein
MQIGLATIRRHLTLRRILSFSFVTLMWLGGETGVLVAQDSAGARVSLLPSGAGVSVVVELDGDTPRATAIEANDNQSVVVEIGPVRGKVANQLLQAAQNSSLVSQVRVRGVTQGAEGTLITIQVVAKSAVSGSVRRSQRRVYIDLEPRDLRAGVVAPPVRADAAEVPAPTQTAGTVVKAPAARPAAPPPAAAPARPATPPAAASAPPVNARTKPGGSPPQAPASLASRAPASAGSTSGTVPARAAGPASTAARASASPSGTMAATPLAPPTAPPPASATAPPAAILPRPSATRPEFGGAVPSTSTPGVRPTAPAPSLEDVQRRAELLVKQPDVKALERLKSDLQARRTAAGATSASTAEMDALLGRFDEYMAEAQRNQLRLDGSLFRGNAPAEAPAPAATPAAAAPSGGDLREFRQAFQPVRPDLESLADALQAWSAGAPPPPNLQTILAGLLVKLRRLKPPAAIAEAHGAVCEALDALALMWAQAAVEPPSEATESANIERSRAAVQEFLRVERTLGASTAAR